ncbi:RNA polymerase II transcription factor SIII subunit A-domain-containing protein [Aspergillus karnatakaensis]|uniref:elongin A domain-containing protein n=1 Tax=Aspergillus karnatakaensis TaxID=1810916 RepID=UPI003CCD7F0E
MPAPSLLQLSTATAIRNVKYLNDIGNLPYALARPFLLKVESPEKLRTIELNSPHIIDEDTELWMEFIKRDIPRWEEYDLPEQPDCWYDLYCALREEVQRAVDEDAEKLKMALDSHNTERAKHSTKLVDRRALGLPRDRPTAKQRYASFDRRMGGARPRAASRAGGGTSDADFDYDRPVGFGPPKTKKNTIFTATKRNGILAVPTKQLSSRASLVRQAPRSLIEEHRRPSEPSVPQRPTLRAPGRSLPGSSDTRTQSSSTASSTLQEREARLRAIAAGRTVNSSSPAIRTPQSSSTRPNLGPSSSSSAVPSSGAQTTAQRTRLQVLPAPNPEGYRSESAANNSTDSATRASPPRPMMRKRPAPNIFMPSKKRKQ